MKRFWTVLLGIFLLAQPVGAQLFQETTVWPPPADGDQLAYMGTYGGVEGPYKGSLNQGQGFGPTFTMYCTDYFHTALPAGTSNSWEINSTQLVGGADLSDTRIDGFYGSVLGLERYRKAAYLATQFTANRSNWVGVQGAIWSFLTTPDDDWVSLQTAYDIDNNVLGPDGINGTADDVKDPDYWRAATNGLFAQGMPAMDWDNWYVMSDVATWNREGMENPEHRQEFLVHATPEPATVVLLLSGLIGVGFAARRQRKEDTV